MGSDPLAMSRTVPPSGQWSMTRGLRARRQMSCSAVLSREAPSCPGHRQKGRRLVKRLTASVLAALALGAAGTAAAGQNASASASGRLASCAGSIGWQTARQKIGSTATVKGRVAGTKYASYSSGSPTFLNVGVDYPSSRRFVVVIWGTNRGRFGAPENRYKGRMICVRGTITTYGGVAQITATSPTQIFIAGS
jgi:hypothetical protein